MFLRWWKIVRFNPLAGKSELRLTYREYYRKIDGQLTSFQSPCREKWIAALMDMRLRIQLLEGEFQSPCGDKWSATQISPFHLNSKNHGSFNPLAGKSELRRQFLLSMARKALFSIVSIPLWGKVNCDFAMRMKLKEGFEKVSIPLRGKVNCDRRLNNRGKRYPRDISIPLRGKVNCDPTMSHFTAVHTVIEFQSPCGEKWIATLIYSASNSELWKAFQSPCGEKWIATFEVKDATKQTRLFQSPCGEKWIATIGRHHMPDSAYNLQNVSIPLRGKVNCD